MRILANDHANTRYRDSAARIPVRMWLTTGDVAKVLRVTRQWVGRLARAGELACEVTESGQRIFRRDAVRRLLIQRTEEQARSRPALLAAVRTRMLKVGYEPRQLSLFQRHGPRLQIIARGERSVSDPEVKAPRSSAETRESDSRSSVNRKVARR